jgi:hypothetical protein
MLISAAIESSQRTLNVGVEQTRKTLNRSYGRGIGQATFERRAASRDYAHGELARPSVKGPKIYRQQLALRDAANLDTFSDGPYPQT